MGVVIKINDTDRSDKIRFESVQISDTINQAIDTCDFVVEEYGSQTFKPVVNDEVIVEIDSVRRFGGVVVDVEQSVEAGVIENKVTCKDWSQHLDRLRITERFEDTNLQEVVQYLVTNYGAVYGFTTTNVMGADFEINSIAFHELTLSECFNKLARLTTFSWYVDPNKDIHFFKKNDELSPFNLTGDSDNYIVDSLVIRSDFSQIRNKIKVRGADARGEERTVKLAGNGETDTFGTELKFAEKPTVRVEGILQDVGVDFLDQDVDHDVMWNYQQKYIKFTTGNIPDAPTDPDITNIEITGIPLKPIVVQVQDTTSVGLYGVYEFVDYDDSLETREQALEYAKTKLGMYADSIRGGSFETYTAGLRSGQTININIPARGINEDFLIQQVSFSMITKDKYVWRVEIATLRTIGMLDILQRLLMEERVNEGEDETLLNFLTLSDGFEFGDELGDITVTTTQDYLIEQDDPGSDTYTNPAIVNKSTVSS